MNSLCSVFRYKGNSQDTDKRVGVAIPDANTVRCEGDFAGRDCSISSETGDLSLGSVRIEDEGPYLCKKSFSDGISDSQFRLRQLNVNGKKFTVVFFFTTSKGSIADFQPDGVNSYPKDANNDLLFCQCP